MGIQIPAYQLRSLVHAFELHADYGQDVVGPFRLLGAACASRPPVHICTHQGLPPNVCAYYFASARLLRIFIILRGVWHGVHPDGLHCDRSHSRGRLDVLRVERTSYSVFLVLPRLLLEARLQGFGQARLLDELDVGVAFQDSHLIGVRGGGVDRLDM